MTFVPCVLRQKAFPTLDAVHLPATGLAVEVELAADWRLHFQKVWQEQDHFHVVVGQVSSTADALGSLEVRPTQQHHRRPLVVIFRVQPEHIKNNDKAIFE